MKLSAWVSPFFFAGMACLWFAASAKAEAMKWTIDGVGREAIVIAPAKTSKTGGAPLVFAFRGHGDTMENFAEGTEFQGYWPEAIVVYMQGCQRRRWILWALAGFTELPGTASAT